MTTGHNLLIPKNWDLFLGEPLNFPSKERAEAQPQEIGSDLGDL